MDRDSWTDTAIETLALNGHDAVRVEPLAKALGVTKGSFYWHFRNRGELLEAVLERWEQVATLQVIERVNAASPNPRGRLKALLRTATDNAAQAAVDGRLRAWGAIDAAAAEVINRVDDVRIRYVTALLVDLGQPRRLAKLRAGALYRTLIGEYTIKSTGGKAAPPAMIEELISLYTEQRAT